MIGVAANSADWGVAEEFFELFKTPWERAVPARRYRVVLSTEGRPQNVDAELLLIYGSKEEPSDVEAGIGVEQVKDAVDIEWAGSPIPIYGHVALFSDSDGRPILKSQGKAVDYRRESGSRIIRRIGYDLFREIDTLLTKGQPQANALTPTVELHIALLRRMLLDSGVSFVEIPPRPDGYDFMCCLTHDLDFFGIRRHKFDRILAGFVVRASLGTLAGLIRGRRSLEEAARNWMALLSLPLVFVGLLPDFWRPFDDYARADNGRPSTFFLLPFKGRPGRAPDGTVNARRGAPYEVSEIHEDITATEARGDEIALHGIDAWCDVDAATMEMKQLTSFTGSSAIGVRMHWLYFTEDSPRQLEAAGFEYDSTCGYNDAVGYRAGTSQVFRLRGTRGLLELPMSIMDTALFYQGRMGLAPNEARQRCGLIVANAKRFGGTVVINWHDRSLAPERLWGRCYQELLSDISQNRVWFTTAGQAVDWFRWRRSIRFTEERNSSRLTVTASTPRTRVPAARVRTYETGMNTEVVRERGFDGREPMKLSLDLQDAS